MGGPVFDKEKCIGCGICASDCAIITLAEKGIGNVPFLPNSSLCIHCGHCVAICQKEAVSHPEMDMDSFKLIGELPNPEAIQLLLESKRSVRQFKDKPIDKEIIQEILNVASQAPSDINSQDRSFYVLTNQKIIKELEFAIVEGFRAFVENALKLGEDENSVVIILSRNIINEYDRGGAPIFKNAPCVIFIYGPPPEQSLFSAFNAITANTYLMLYAHSLGIESCIIGRALYNTDRLAKYLNIPSSMKVYTAATLGYAKVKYKKTVDRKPNVTWN